MTIARVPFLAAAALATALAAQAPPAQADTLVRCESDEGHTQRCAADTRNGVVLHRQLSHAGCWQGDTWSYDSRGIWVSNGCRAEFAVGDAPARDSDNSRGAAIAGAVALGILGAAVISHNRDRDRDRDYGYDDRYDPYPNPGRMVTCESRDRRYNQCNVGGRRARVELYRQLSDSPCRYGSSWGRNRGGVWVDRGCRAQFSVYY